MADVPVQLIVAAFQDEKGADNALSQLKEAKKEKLVNIKDAAVLRKDDKGELHVSEIGDMTGARGGMIGGVVGARARGHHGRCNARARRAGCWCRRPRGQAARLRV